MKNPPQICGFFSWPYFTIKLGKKVTFLDKMCPPGGVSPMYVCMYIYIYGYCPPGCLHFWPPNPFPPRVWAKKMAPFFTQIWRKKKNEAFQPYETRKHALPPSLHTKMTKNALKPLVLQCFDQKHVSNTGNVNNVFNVLPTCL